MDENDRTICRTPTKGRDGVTRIPTWKYIPVRQAILDVIKTAGSDGVAFKDLPDLVSKALPDDVREKLGSVRWHTTSVKLNMEVDGEIRRLPGKGAQRLVLTQ